MAEPTIEQLHVAALNLIGDDIRFPFDPDLLMGMVISEEAKYDLLKGVILVNPITRDFIAELEEKLLVTDEDREAYYHEIILIRIGFYESGRLPRDEFVGVTRDNHLTRALPAEKLRALHAIGKLVVA